MGLCCGLKLSQTQNISSFENYGWGYEIKGLEQVMDPLESRATEEAVLTVALSGKGKASQAEATTTMDSHSV